LQNMDKRENIIKLEELLIKYEKKIFNLLYSLSSNTADAQDLAQETFIKAYKKIHTFRQESEISTWLCRIAINSWKNRVRYNSRRRIFKILSLDFLNKDEKPAINNIRDNFPEPEQETISKEMMTAVQSEISSLPPKYKIALTLHINNMPYKEMAEILRCRQGTVKSLVCRAKVKLKQKMMSYL